LRSFVVGRAAQAAAALLLTFLTVRLLEPVDYGAYMLVWAAVELMFPLTSLGIVPTSHHFLPRLARGGQPRQLRCFILGMGLARYALLSLMCALVLTHWDVAGDWVGLSAASACADWVFCLLIVAVVGGRLAAQMLEALLEQRHAQLANTLQMVLRLVGLLVLWTGAWLTLERLLWVDLGVSLFTWLLAQFRLMTAVRQLRPDGSDPVNWAEVRRSLGYMSGSQLLGAAGSAGAVRLVVGRVLGAEMAGAFGFLQQLVMIANRYLPSLLLANVVRPMLIARYHEGRVADVRVGFGLLSKVNLLLGLGLFAIVVVGGDELVALASGDRVLGAGWSMALMTVALLFMGQNQVMSMAMEVYGLLGSVFAVSLLGPLVIPFAMTGGHLGGVVGVAAGVAAAMSVRSIASTVLLQRRAEGVRRDWRGTFGAIVALLAATALAWMIGRWVGPLAAAACLPFLALPLLWLARPLHPLEAALLVRGAGRWGRWFGPWTSR
jgi:O-antigen/teichoic acid export membrane protein